MKTIKSLYLNNIVFFLLIGIVTLFCIAYLVPWLYQITWYLLLMFTLFLALDLMILFFTKTGIEALRQAPEKLSNGDENPIIITVQNHYTFKIAVKIIDEVPFQFQMRNFFVKRNIKAQTIDQFQYFLRPTERGEYSFGDLNVYVASPLGLAARRFRFQGEQMVPTYPSYIQLKKYDLMAFSNQLVQYGVKKIRRIGHTMEFEQIKEYVNGDDLRTLNWKATAKRQQLMVNFKMKNRNLFI